MEQVKMQRFFAIISNSEVPNVPRLSAAQLWKNGISVVTAVVAILAVIMIIFSGFQYLTSNGDPQKAATAMKTLLYSIIGFVVAVAAWSIVTFVVKVA
jgi:hypothetical protein